MNFLCTNVLSLIDYMHLFFHRNDYFHFLFHGKIIIFCLFGCFFYAISLPLLPLNLIRTSPILAQLSSVTLTFRDSSHFKVPDDRSVFHCLHISKKSTPSPKQCLITSNVLTFYGKNPKLKNHPYTSVRYS